MTTVEQEEVLAKNVIERARQQIMLFRIILLMVSTVIIALIIFTMTMEKTRDIATLKIIGAPNLKIGALIMQESLGLGLLGYLFGALLINLPTITSRAVSQFWRSINPYCSHCHVHLCSGEHRRHPPRPRDRPDDGDGGRH